MVERKGIEMVERKGIGRIRSKLLAESLAMEEKRLGRTLMRRVECQSRCSQFVPKG